MVVGFRQTIAGAQFAELLSDIVDAMMALPNLASFRGFVVGYFQSYLQIF